MEIKIKVILIEKDKTIPKLVYTNERLYKKHKAVLTEHNRRIVTLLKKYKKEQKIKTIFRPVDITLIKTRKIDGRDMSFRNKEYDTVFQKHLDNLIEAKQTNKIAIDKMDAFFK